MAPTTNPPREPSPLAWRFSWRAYPPVHWWQRPPLGKDSPAFDWLRRLHGWRGEGWPVGGVYAYEADVVGWDWPQRQNVERSVSVDGSAEGLSDLVRDLIDVRPGDPTSTRLYLEKWGLLGVGLSTDLRPVSGADATWRGAMVCFDGAARTAAAIRSLQEIVRAKDRGNQLAAWHELRQTSLLGRVFPATATVDLTPGGVFLGTCWTQYPIGVISTLLLQKVLIACEGCGAYFEPTHRARRYCSERCQKTDQMRKQRRRVTRKGARHVSKARNRRARG
jgi:hypothetical protein